MRRTLCHRLASLPLLLSVASGARCDEPAFDVAAAGGFIEQYCVDCHNAEDPQANLNLVGFAGAQTLAEARPKWQKLVRRVKQHEMPPPDVEQPSVEQRAAFTKWVADTL